MLVTERHSEKKRHPAWTVVLAPSLVGLTASLLATVATSFTTHAAVNAALSAQVANHEVRLKAAEEVINALPHAYVPRVEMDHAELEKAKITEMRNAQLNRMEAQIDTLVQSMLTRR